MARDERRALIAHVAPFALFMLGIALLATLRKFASPDAATLLAAKPEYWIYPLQTVVCALALAIFWKSYDFGSQRPIPLAVGVGLLAFGLWVSPQWLFGQPARLEGFDPTVFAGDPRLYWCSLAARFLRIVIVVPLIEEIFWRGFLQRYLIDERFTAVPFGKYTHLSFWGVAVCFTFVHLPADWPAALATGALYGWLAVRTRTLLAPIVAHAVTNLALGLYIMKTGQWGFW